MIYVAIGNSTDKMDNNNCVNKNGKLICTPSHLPDLPKKYKEIQNKCGIASTENVCQILNSIPSKISKHSLCQWKENKCKPRRTLSSHYLIGNHESLQDLYKELGQEEVYNDIIKMGKEELQKGIKPENIKLQFNNANQVHPFKRSIELFTRWNGSSRKKRIAKRKTRRVKK
jgi:hypothetical protein